MTCYFVSHLFIPPAGEFDLMEVVFGGLRIVVVDGEFDVVHIEAPGCDVSRQQNGAFA